MSPEQHPLERGVKHAAKAAMLALGLGHPLEQLRQIRGIGFPQWAKVELARRYELSRIDAAPPIASVPGAPEAHMLLHHARVREGAWALYSLAHFARVPLAFVIHEDGSLVSADRALLSKLFPGCRIVDRGLADTVARERLLRAGFARCHRLREELVFGLKLFDPFFFAESRTFFVLDSDVIFARQPQDLVRDLSEPGAPPLYSVDNGDRYCVPDHDLSAMLGRTCIPRFNPGVLRAHSTVLDLERCERYLEHPGFWSQGKADYYAELTLWAMLLTTAEARPLPSTYAICPDFRQPFVYGHYCGGGFWASIYYSDVLPLVVRSILGTPR
jgi:hypothetical protein